MGAARLAGETGLRDRSGAGDRLVVCRPELGRLAGSWPVQRANVAANGASLRFWFAGAGSDPRRHHHLANGPSSNLTARGLQSAATLNGRRVAERPPTVANLVIAAD